MVMPKLSIEECKKYLPEDITLTDSQVEHIRDGLIMIANAVFDWKMKGLKK
jgi:predicted DNA-binding protein